MRLMEVLLKQGIIADPGLVKQEYIHLRMMIFNWLEKRLGVFG